MTLGMVRDGGKHFRPIAMSTLLSSLATTVSLLLLLLLVGSMTNWCASASSCLSSEASILLRIKQDLQLSNGRLSSWIAHDGSYECCMWEGIDCDPHTGHVIGLQLRARPTIETIPHIITDIDDGAMKYDVYDSFVEEGRAMDPRDITGSRIPPALFELHQLQHLDLSGCDFNGSTIPPGLAQLTRLTHLNLSRAWFSGQVPNEISSLFNLVSLDLSYISHLYFDVPYDNWFETRPIDNLELQDLEGFVQNFKHLKYLHLDSVGIKPRNPQEWSVSLSSALPNLQSLSLISCRLSGSLTPHIFNLPHLQALDLSDNLGLVGKLTPSFFPPHSNLHSLSLVMTSLSGHVPFELFDLPHLKVLDLTYSVELRGPLPTRLPKSKLQVLKLYNVALSGGVPDWIGNLTSLVELNLKATGISGNLPVTFGNLRCLRSLDLSINSLSGNLPVTIGNLTALTHLDLSYTSLSGRFLHTIANLTTLTYLRLSGTSLSGSPLIALEDLTALRHLDLSGTSLSGSLPIMLGKLTALSYLDLSDCKFTSIDSSLFANLTHLTYLELSRNIFSGLLPSLPYYLRGAHLSDNNFSGPIPKSYNLLNMVLLDLSRNSLTGTVPSSLTHGPSFMQSPIRYLDLSNNRFHGYLNLGIFANFKNLYFLSLSRNNWTVDVHDPTLKFPSLQELRLVSCNISQFPQFLRHHKPIHSLDLSNNVIVGDIPKWLKVSRSLIISHNMITSIGEVIFLNLEKIDLSSNMLNRLPEFISPSTGPFNNMAYFSIKNNRVKAEIPAFLCSFTNILFLDLSNNKFSGQLPACLFQLGLVELKLQNNQLQGQIPEFGDYTRMSTLDLSGNRLVGYVPTSLGNCKELEFINLGHNKLSGEFPVWLGKLPRLKLLVLRSNSLSGAINFNLDKNAFQELVVLDISTNQFSGKIPVGLLLSLNAMKTFSPRSVIPSHFMSRYSEGRGGTADTEVTDGFYEEWEVTLNTKGIILSYERGMLSIMKTIDISNNCFDGGIPEKLGDLSGLQALRISNNKLKGPIPKSIGALQHLESLDLSRNFLSGEIPQEVATLNFLEYLNLSYNNLSGRIPQTPHFSTFNVQCFEGNPSLCGPPLSLSCETNNATTLMSPLLGLNEEMMWKYISVGLGLGLGFGTTISFSFFLSSIRRHFNRCWRRCHWSSALSG